MCSNARQCRECKRTYQQAVVGGPWDECWECFPSKYRTAPILPDSIDEPWPLNARFMHEQHEEYGVVFVSECGRRFKTTWRGMNYKVTEELCQSS